LAEHDVASVFTLPKIIYGRQDIISEMTCIIERTSGIYRQIRSKKEKSYTSSVRATISDVQNSNASGSDYCFSDSHSINEVTSFPDRKSPISSSFYSGLDGSDGSSSMSGVGQNLDKQGAEIVCLAGPGGVGKSTLFKSVQKTARQHGFVSIKNIISTSPSNSNQITLAMLPPLNSIPDISYPIVAY
jgi:ABC-type glutathione transport system ATPase component